MSDKESVTIIGAGIIGISSAVFLQKQGFLVTVIDREEPGDGCSFGNACGVVPSSLMPDMHAGVLTKLPGWLLDPLGPLTIRWRHFPKALPWMLRAARNTIPTVARHITESKAALNLRVMSDYESIMSATKTRDLLNLDDAIRPVRTAKNNMTARPMIVPSRQNSGFAAKRLSIREICEMEPDIAADFACGSFHGGWYRLSNPKTLVARMAQDVVRNGGTIIRDDVVQAVHDGQHATHIKLQQGGEMAVDRLVIAAGAYSDILARQLGSRVLLEAERGYHLTIPNSGVNLGRTVTWATRPGAITPMDAGLRLAGTDEFAGCDAAPNWKRAEIMWRIYKRVLPNLRPLDDTATKWMGRRPGTPDSLPVIGPSPLLENVWYGFGHGHLGMTWGPTTGRLVAELIAGRPSNLDMSPYSITRF